MKSLRDHVLSHNPTISHYRRKHAPNRLYLSPELTIQSMLNDYNSRREKNTSYSKYQTEIRKMNISFAKLGEERCEKCMEHQEHVKDVHSNVKNVETDDGESIYPEICTICIEYNHHIDNANSTGNEYKKDKEGDPDKAYYSVDMQKVMMLPRLPGVKTAIFTKRMVCFHETFAPLGSFTSDNRPIGIIWNEAISGRSAGDVASAFNCFLTVKCDVKHFVLWANNCGVQSKNCHCAQLCAQQLIVLTAPEVFVLSILKLATHLCRLTLSIALSNKG